MSTLTSETISCQRCGREIDPDDRACRACGELRYRQRLEALARHAYGQESVSPHAAASAWGQMLPLLPAGSREHQAITDRIRMLGSGAVPPRLPERRVPPRDTPGVAFFKTAGSMVLSIAVYSTVFGWAFAAGFVLLILVHEMGHVAAMRYYGLSAGPPIFIPFLGALIDLREAPPNAKVEAIVGIGGPLLGTLGALACFAIYLWTGHPLALTLSFFGFALNLFNMLPVPPLDGGRVTAAVSPWIWMVGIVALIGIVINDLMRMKISPILLLLLFYAFPRIWRTLRGQERRGPYYDIPRRDSLLIGALYLALGALLAVFFFMTKADAMILMGMR